MRLLSSVLFVALLLAACAQPESPATEAETAPTGIQPPDALNLAGLEQATVPPLWQWRFDRGSDYTVGADPDSSDTWFVTMTPGWHLKTQPAGIFYHPGLQAEGSYIASTTLHLFNPGGRNEGYGLIVGGSDLEGDGQQYLYFLLRRSGEYLVKLRRGSETEEVIPWTAHESVAAWAEDSEGTVTNELAVEVMGDMLHFRVNDVEVASIPKGDLPTDGQVGLRLNHAVELHITDLKVDPGTA